MGATVRRAAKVDRNQAQITTALRDVGATVQPIHTIGNGVPDLLVGYRGVNFLLEIKDGTLSPSRRVLTQDEAQWHLTWRGAVTVVNDENEALRAIGAIL